jgi:DNA modification methylase
MAPIGYLETGVIYCDDNLHRLSQFPAECIDLIYVDPPFFSNKHYEVIWGDEAEVRSFEDRWEGGIHVYVEWMRERVMELHRILKPTGTLYLHCDEHASHYLKVMLDEVFGRDNFLNEIIWHYQTSSGAPKKWLHRNHDTIFRYAARKPSLVTWNHPREPWPEATLKKWQRDEQGRIYRVQNKFDKRYYIDPAGKLADDVWEITLSSRTKERLGYPTQKPEALMEKIIAASSNPGDIVLDAFCGCGTTLVAAQRLGRQWVGIDISPTAVDLERRRLLKIGATEVKLVGMPVTEAQLHALKPFEYQNWVVARMNGTHSPKKSGDMGIDGFSFMLHEPIQVKQSSGIGRNIVDNFETALKRAGKDKGYIVAFSFGKGAYEEAARVKGADGLTVVLLTVADLLEGKADLVTPETGLFGGDVPMPEPRPPEVRPSVDVLIASNKGSQVPQKPAHRESDT